MININTSMDLRPEMAIAKPRASLSSFSMPAILGFKTLEKKEKALIRIKKIKRRDNIIIPGVIDDDYVDIVEEKVENYDTDNFFTNQNIFSNRTQQVKYLKNCYIVDYIQSPKQRCGMGTNAIKSLAEKAMFDPRTNGRIVTFSAPMTKESSPALFFYKLGFRFTTPSANEYLEKCIRDNMPDIPAQTGMMYLPKDRLHKLLRYGELF